MLYIDVVRHMEQFVLQTVAPKSKFKSLGALVNAYNDSNAELHEDAKKALKSPQAWARQLLSVHYGLQQLKAEGTDAAHGQCDSENAFAKLFPVVLRDLEDELGGDMNDVAINELIETLKTGNVFDAKPSLKRHRHY
jgi:hypothetical protein